jgi:hypothetical protein
MWTDTHDLLTTSKERKRKGKKGVMKIVGHVKPEVLSAWFLGCYGAPSAG